MTALNKQAHKTENERMAKSLAERNGEPVEGLRQRISELEEIATDYGMKFQKAQDALKHQALLHKSQMEAAEQRNAELVHNHRVHAARLIDERGQLKQRIAELESRTVTLEPFRSFVTDADITALHRFAECCDDPESGGHDLEKEQVRRLEAIGALQRSGRISYITGFGDVLISITSGIGKGE